MCDDGVQRGIHRTQNQFIVSTPERYNFYHNLDLDNYFQINTKWKQSLVSLSPLSIERLLMSTDKFENVLGGVNSTGK